MEKTSINVVAFEKKIEIEAQNLMYFDYMKKEKALEKAREFIGSKFKVI